MQESVVEIVESVTPTARLYPSAHKEQPLVCKQETQLGTEQLAAAVVAQARVEDPLEVLETRENPARHEAH